MKGYSTLSEAMEKALLLMKDRKGYIINGGSISPDDYIENIIDSLVQILTSAFILAMYMYIITNVVYCITHSNV